MTMASWDEHTYQGTNSLHPCLHIAYLMGCSPIVLLGIDCQWEDGKLHFCEFEGQPKDPYVKPMVDNRVNSVTGKMRESAHFIDNQQESDLSMWGLVAKYNPDANIINASGGRVECFRRRSLDEICKSL